MNTEPTTTVVRTAQDVHVYVRPLFGVQLGQWIDRRIKEGHLRGNVIERAEIFRQNLRIAQKDYVRALDEAFDHGASLGLSGLERAEHAQDYTAAQRLRLANLLLTLEQ